jgi:hypothetical protein
LRATIVPKMVAVKTSVECSAMSHNGDSRNYQGSGRNLRTRRRNMPFEGEVVK